MSDGYTIAEIDAAIEAITPHATKRIQGLGWSRPTAMLGAAAQSWIHQRPDDEHARVIRSALLDLHNTGCLHPHDGIWPES